MLLRAVQNKLDNSLCSYQYNENIITAPFTTTAIRNVAVRVAVIGDIRAQGVLGWLQLVAPNQEICTVSESYVANITSDRDEYDIFFAAGSDTRRLQRLIRLYTPVLTRKPKIAILIGGSPSERTKLLKSGFDDVFDQRTPVPEAQARLLAHFRRYNITSKLQEVRDMPLFNTSQWCEQPLTKREQEILYALVETSPSPVLIDHLRRSQSGKRELANSSVRVVISNIRAKLKPGIKITFISSSYFIDREIND